jgi:hypothetical protein
MTIWMMSGGCIMQSQVKGDVILLKETSYDLLHFHHQMFADVFNGRIQD